MPYYGFSYYINPLNATYPGPCPGPGAPTARPGVGSPLPSDTWCALDEPLDHFYDHGLANNTIARLRHAAGRLKAEERPFFVMSGFARPHAPWRIPQRFWDMYRTEDIPLPRHRLPPTNMPGIAWFPLNFYNSSTGWVFPLTITSPLDLWAQRHMRHAYYAAVSFLDFEVGRVLDELDALRVADRTAVVFHGDHGWQLGEHNSWHKFTNFELATRVPLLIRAPWIKQSAGRKTHAFAELVAVYATLAEITGSPKPSNHLDGKSLAPLLRGEATASTTFAFSQYPHTSDFGCPFVRNGSCHDSPTSDRTVEPNNSLQGMSSMGYTVRSRSYRFVCWLPWNATTLATNWSATHTAADVSQRRFDELYPHTGEGDESCFDCEDEPANLAYEPSRAGVVRQMFAVARDFFTKP